MEPPTVRPPAVRLYTDAGIRNGVATWGIVALLPEGGEPIEAKGRFRQSTGCSTTAELRAIANALHRLARLGHLPPGSAVRVMTDSRHAVDRLTGRMTVRPQSPAAVAAEVVLRIARDRGLSLKVGWVPGHKPDSHSEHAPWNNRADRLCREARA